MSGTVTLHTQAANSQCYDAEAQVELHQKALQTELAAQQTSENDMSALLTRLRSELAESREGSALSKREAVTASEKMLEQSANLASADAEHEKTKAALAALDIRVQGLICDCHMLEAASADTSAIRRQLQADLDSAHASLEASNRDLSQSKSALETMTAGLRGDLDQLQKELQTVENVRKHATDELTQASEQFSQERSQWSEQEAGLQQQINDLKTTAQGAEQSRQEVIALQQQLQDASTQAHQNLERKQSEFKEQLADADQTTERKQQEFQLQAAEQQERIEHLQRELAEEQQARSTEKASLQAELQAVQQRVTESASTHEEEQQSLQTQLQQLTNTHQERLQELSSLRQELEEAAILALDQAAAHRLELEQQDLRIRDELHEQFAKDLSHLHELESVEDDMQQKLQEQKASATHVYSRYCFCYFASLQSSKPWGVRHQMMVQQPFRSVHNAHLVHLLIASAAHDLYFLCMLGNITDNLVWCSSSCWCLPATLLDIRQLRPCVIAAANQNMCSWL